MQQKTVTSSSKVKSGCISALKEGSTNLMAQIGKGILFLIQVLSPTMWAAVGITLLLALLALSVLCYRKACLAWVSVSGVPSPARSKSPPE